MGFHVQVYDERLGSRLRDEKTGRKMVAQSPEIEENERVERASVSAAQEGGRMGAIICSDCLAAGCRIGSGLDEGP